MNDLSPETVRQILYFIPAKSDLESFRLVQHSFADLGKEFLFHTIDVWPTRESLNRLRELSRRSDLALRVRCLVLNFVYDTKNLIWSRVKENLHFPNSSHAHGPVWDLYEHNAGVFNRIATKSFDFMVSRDHASILMASLVRLRRLETIQTRDGGGNEGCIMTAKEEADHFGAWGLSEYPGEPGSWDDPNSYFAIEALRALVDASLYADTKIKSFQTINEIPQRIFEEPALLKSLAGFLKHCRQLKLRFDTENHELVVPYLKKNPLAVVFSSTKLLEKLHLEFSVRPDISVGFTKIVGDQQISVCLKEINFVGIDMHDYELYAFLSLHKKTLRRFSIHHSKLFTGYWLNVAKWMRENLNLKSVEFVGIANSDSDGDHEETMKEKAAALDEVRKMVSYVLYGK